MATEDHIDIRAEYEPSGETPFKAEGELTLTDGSGKTRQVWFKLDGRETFTVNRGAEEEWTLDLSDADSGNDLAKTHSGKNAPELPEWLKPAIDLAHKQREEGDFYEWVD